MAEFCAGRGIRAVVTVATEYGESLLKKGGSVDVLTGAMDLPAMEEFLKKWDVERAVDATHPYAVQVTANAKAACAAAGIPYVRCVRESGWSGETAGASVGGEAGAENAFLVRVDTAAQAAHFLAERQGPALLLTGSKTAAEYTVIPDFAERLYLRILPEESQVAKCRALGFTGPHLICMQGPFSLEMNVATIRQTGARFLVTKDGGAAGGFEEKIEAAKICGITAVVIGRGAAEDGLTLGQVKRLLAPGKPPVYMIGIGMGDEDTLTEAAKKVVAGCGLLVGAERMVRAAAVLAPSAERAVCCLPDKILKALEQYEGSDPAAVVFSGDTGFYSGAKKALRAVRAAGFSVTVIPGISSMAYLAAKIGQTWEDAAVISLHGREAAPEEPFLAGGGKAFYLLDGDHRAGDVLRILTDCGFGMAMAAVGENMGGPDERITKGAAAELAGRPFGALAAMMVYFPKDGEEETL